jgi:hypothetical protein
MHRRSSASPRRNGPTAVIAQSGPRTTASGQVTHGRVAAASYADRSFVATRPRSAKISGSAEPECIENPLPSRPCCPGCQRTLNQFDIRFPASRSFILCPIACEAVQICASAIFLLSEGHSAFPDQRMALFSSRFQFRGESSPVSFRSKRRPFCGENWGLLAIICRFKKT